MPVRRRVLTLLVATLASAGRAASAAEGSAAPLPPASSADPPPGPHDPLAGFAGERAFLRTPSNEIVLFPSVLLQVGGAFFPQQQYDLRSGFYLRRARVELAGWMGPMFYFDVAGDFAPDADPASTAAHPPTDAYVAFAPVDDAFILQVGQFDAPFSLENRTLEAYTPFIERSLAVRTLAVPNNKDLGVMVHGTDAARTVYYSGGIFNGDGPGIHNADNQVDFIGRVTVAPLARSSIELLHDASLGVSAWYGQHVAGLPFAPQTTPGGFVFFKPTWMAGPTGTTNLDLREDGSTLTLGGELSLPITHQVGLRVEGFFKKQNLGEDSVAVDGTTSTLGLAKLQAIAGYAEAWLWLMGDDRQLPRPGYELPTRLGHLAEPSTEHGLMLTARGELLKEDLTSTQTQLADRNLATTRMVSASLALNYWYGRRVRASFNYVLNLLSGTTENVTTTLATDGKSEQELLLLLAMGL
jgi:phosphate-selective porin OprO and OprP